MPKKMAREITIGDVLKVPGTQLHDDLGGLVIEICVAGMRLQPHG